jgi:capsular polysaccharide biosynthesis protein
MEAKDIDLKELMEIILKKWWLIILLTLFGAGSAYVLTEKYITPVYEAKTVLYIGSEDSGLGTIGLSIGQLQAGSQLIIDYKQIALTHLVVDKVIQNLGLNISYDAFQKNVVIASVEDSRLFTVGFKNADPMTAKIVSDELAKQLTVAVFEIVGVENIRILDQAAVPQTPVAPSKSLNALNGGMLGFLIALFITIVLFLMKDTVKNEEDVEKLIGTPVLGSIPEFKGEAK